MCECRGGNGDSCPETQSAVGYDAASSSDLFILTVDCTNARSCRSSPFLCIAQAQFRIDLGRVSFPY